jgi:hypothetical protein
LLHLNKNNFDITSTSYFGCLHVEIRTWKICEKKHKTNFYGEFSKFMYLSKAPEEKLSKRKLSETNLRNMPC